MQDGADMSEEANVAAAQACSRFLCDETVKNCEILAVELQLPTCDHGLRQRWLCSIPFPLSLQSLTLPLLRNIEDDDFQRNPLTLARGFVGSEAFPSQSIVSIASYGRSSSLDSSIFANTLPPHTLKFSLPTVQPENLISRALFEMKLSSRHLFNPLTVVVQSGCMNRLLPTSPDESRTSLANLSFDVFRTAKRKAKERKMLWKKVALTNDVIDSLLRVCQHDRDGMSKSSNVVPQNGCRQSFSVSLCNDVSAVNMVSEVTIKSDNVQSESSLVGRHLKSSEVVNLDLGMTALVQNKPTLFVEPHTMEEEESMDLNDAVFVRGPLNSIATAQFDKNRDMEQPPAPKASIRSTINESSMDLLLFQSDSDGISGQPPLKSSATIQFRKASRAKSPKKRPKSKKGKTGIASKYRNLKFSPSKKSSQRETLVVNSPVKKKMGSCSVDTSDDSNYIRVESFETWDCWFGAFTSFKSIAETNKLLNDAYLRKFYKCMIRHCMFAEDDVDEFANHLRINHLGTVQYCCYCLCPFAIKELVDHVVSAHGGRRYQCSGCPYRASSKKHLQFHSHDYHGADFFRCRRTADLRRQEPPPIRKIKKYRCVVQRCRFQTVFSRTFIEHIRAHHSHSTTSYCCGFCPIETHLPISQLLLHCRQQHDMYEFECAYCDYGCVTAPQIIRHLCLAHPDQKMVVITRLSNEVSHKIVPDFVPNYARSLVCRHPECSFKAWNVTAYLNHVSAFHEQFGLSCPHCSLKLKTSYDLEEHVHMHGPTLYRCNRCDFMHWQIRTLKDHLMRIHGMIKCHLEVIRELQDPCLPPIATLASSSGRRHSNDESGHSSDSEVVVSSQKPFVCSQCDKFFSTKNSLLIHYKKKHVFRQIVRCEICSEIFSSQKVRLLHHKLHHSSNPVRPTAKKKFAATWCFMCTYHTKNKEHLREHLYTEFRYLPFRCTVCDFGSKRKSLVVSHGEKEHGDRSSWMQITDTDLEEWTSGYLARGPAKVDGRQLFSNDGHYLCVFCRTVVRSPRRYRLHLFSHLRYRKFRCQSCGLRFLGKSSVRKHSVEVHGTRPRQLRPVFRLPRIEEWVEEKLTTKEPDTEEICLDEGPSNYGNLAPVDLSRLHFYIPGPCDSEIRVPVSEGFKYMKLEVKVQVERFDWSAFMHCE